MKKQVLGSFIAGFAFIFGIYISPIRFISGGIGHGATPDFTYGCKFSNNISNHFSSVFQWSCNYQSPETASKIFENKVSDLINTVEPVKEIKLENGKTLRRAIIKIYHEDVQFYCLVRADGNWVDELTSTSLRHIREFEEQKFKH